MKNVWNNLKDEDTYILEEDKQIVEEFNLTAKDDFKIRLEFLPEPFVGNIDAPIVLLSLNPGVDEEDSKFHKDPYFKKILFENLSHKLSEYPFYFLNPKLEHTPGAKWWLKKLNQALELIDRKELSKKLLCIEYFPYHSKKYKKMKKIYSQQYNFYLVKEAIKRNAKIIIMRNEENWKKAIPQLAEYPYYTLKNKQGAFLTKNNIIKNHNNDYLKEIFISK